jgi:hypothetical protein
MRAATSAARGDCCGVECRTGQEPQQQQPLQLPQHGPPSQPQVQVQPGQSQQQVSLGVVISMLMRTPLEGSITGWHDRMNGKNGETG